MSTVLVSMCTCCPGRISMPAVNGRSGRFAVVRLVVAAPKAWLPRSNSSTMRYSTRSLGTSTLSPSAAASNARSRPNITFRVTVDFGVCVPITSRRPATTRSSTRAKASPPCNARRLGLDSSPTVPSPR
jgi:hypothetical protein